MNNIVYLNGEFLPKDEAHVSPDDRGFLFADGVYEVVLSYRGTPFRKREHLERLANGLRAIRLHSLDVEALGDVADELLQRNGVAREDVVVYLQVTRGAATRKHSFPTGNVAPTVYAMVFPFAPKGDPAAGGRIITVPDTRWARCDIKSIGLLPNCLANQQAQEAGAGEAVFVRDGAVLEGTASSFFAVTQGVVRTAPLTNYILPGITRHVVLELCTDNEIPAKEESIYVHELATADEMFLAGTTTEILPIVNIDCTPVGSGASGPVTKRLVGLFREATRASDLGTVSARSA